MRSNPFTKIARYFYAFSFFDNFVLIYPIYTLLFADSGITPRQISWLFIVWSLATFLLELPSGALADKYSRKNILIIGQVAKALGFVSWLLFQNFWGFLVGFLLWAVKVAFTSGTKEAYVYDELRAINKKSHYAQVTGAMYVAILVGVITSGALASWLAPRGYNLILVLSILSVLVSSIIVMLLPNAHKAKNNEVSEPYFTYLKGGVLEVFKKPVVTKIVLSISFIMGFSALDEYFGLFFRAKGLPNSSVAAWVTVTFVFAMIGSAQAYRFAKTQIKMTYFILLWGVLLLAAAYTFRWLAPLLLGLYMLVFSGLLVILNTQLQHQLTDKVRATASSLSGFLTEILSLGVFFILGFSSNNAGYVSAYQSIGWILIGVAGVLIVIHSIAFVHRKLLTL